MTDRLKGTLTSGVLQLLEMRRRIKRSLLISVDFALLLASLWVGYSLRYRDFYVPQTWEALALMVLAPLITIATFFHLDLYRRVTRYIGGSSFNTIGFAMCISVFVWATIVWLTQLTGVPRLAAVLYVVFGTSSVWGVRQLVGWVLRNVAGEVGQLASTAIDRRTNILIYGAGSAGKMLADALVRSSHYDPVGFVDANPTLWGQFVGNLKVFRPDRLPSMVARYDVREILLALPSVGRADRQAIVRSLEPLKVSVRTLPTLEELAHGQLTVRDLRPIGVVDLLGRDPVAPIPGLIEIAIAGKSIMVTGAGGSIGSEIVRQCLNVGPARLVLFEASENALYTIGLEVDRWLATRPQGQRPRIVTVLGSVVDASAIERAIRENGVQTIYHAAAYKHVPMVEANPAAGLFNNTFGTITVARAAQRLNIERFVCISTDKAVRPTNVMGASKRLAEMMLQTIAGDQGSSTVVTMVRFGNVLGSSGSVVPLFRQQIEAGGPVTVTHRDMVRYFMSIPEAALLVLQAGAMAKGGEVFVLDMGEPVKIDDLARSMIRLAGLTVRDAANPLGDIEIVYVGLRPGEKLYEELFLGTSLQNTAHPRIMSSLEPVPARSVLEKELAVLYEAIERDDGEAMIGVLTRLVEGFQDTGRPALEHADATASGRQTLH